MTTRPHRGWPPEGYLVNDTPRFADYRERLADAFAELGLQVGGWRLFQASSYGGPRLRPARCEGGASRAVSRRFRHDRISDPTNERREYGGAAVRRQWRDYDLWLVTNELDGRRLVKAIEQVCTGGVEHLRPELLAIAGRQPNGPG